VVVIATAAFILAIWPAVQNPKPTPGAYFYLSNLLTIAVITTMTFCFVRPLCCLGNLFESRVMRTVVLRAGAGAAVHIAFLLAFFVVNYIWLQTQVSCRDPNEGTVSQVEQTAIIITVALPINFHVNISHRDDVSIVQGARWLLNGTVHQGRTEPQNSEGADIRLTAATSSSSFSARLVASSSLSARLTASSSFSLSRLTVEREEQLEVSRLQDAKGGGGGAVRGSSNLMSHPEAPSFEAE